jgi:hypothetical protein
MSTVVLDGITPHLGQLIQLSTGFANYGLSKVGYDLQEAMKQKTRSYGTHNWSQKFDVNARRTISRGTKKYYSRFSHKSGGEQNGMDDFIKSKIYPETNKLIVGFIDTKAYQTYSFDGGIQKKFRRVKGQKPNDIAEKMDKGGRENLTQKQRAFFRASGFYGIAKKGYVTKTARPVVNPALSASIGKINKRFGSAYKKALEEAKIKTTQKRVTA